MKFWQPILFTEPEQLVEVARIAEDVGFDGVLISDHLLYPGKIESAYPYAANGEPPFDPETDWPDVWCAISAMAAVTERIRFATMVYILPLRDPIEVAKQVSTAAVLSRDRVVLGVGVGWMKEEFEQLGRDFHTRGRRFDEMVEVMRKLWTGEMVEHHGKHYDLDPLLMRPAPSRPVPIYIGGQSEPALRRAARLGDGWIGAAAYAPDDVPAIAGRLQELRKQEGREHLPFDIMLPIAATPSPDLYRRLEDQGVTSTTSSPFSYSVGPRSTLDQKRRLLEDYAENVIRKMK